MDRDAALSAALLLLLLSSAAPARVAEAGKRPAPAKHQKSPVKHRTRHAVPLGAKATRAALDARLTDGLTLLGSPDLWRLTEQTLSERLATGGLLFDDPRDEARPPSMVEGGMTTTLPPPRVWLSYRWTF